MIMSREVLRTRAPLASIDEPRKFVDLRGGSVQADNIRASGHIVPRKQAGDMTMPFVTHEPDTEVLCKTTGPYAPENDHGLAFDDPALGIAEALPLSSLPLSERDRKHPRLAEMLRFFD
ncbi:dTDP-4-dehydrorhamnose 3,5-epimerase family protein [Bosea sp. 2YAB26]|uniref:dTDP-4-dehydrorhamnose 3,5-epimerase family protein n=1 Tax=Bosea sp. 2YAB26 TaxID=3237478 RepID=UPI003F902015